MAFEPFRPVVCSATYTRICVQSVPARAINHMGKAEVPFHTLFMMRLYALKGSLYENSLNPIWRFVALLLKRAFSRFRESGQFWMVCGFLFSCLVYSRSIKYTVGRYGFNFDGSLDFCVGCGSFGRLTKNGLNKAIKLQLSFYYPQAVFVGRVKYLLAVLCYGNFEICCLHRFPICCLTFFACLKDGK